MYTVCGYLLYVCPSHTDRCGINADNWASIITVDFLKCIFIGRKFMTNLDSMLKSRDIILLTKVHIIKVWSSQWSQMVLRAGRSRRQSTKELMP